MRRKREKGRPLKHRYPPRIDATPEQIARAFFGTPPNSKVKAHTEYRCVDCKQEVNYPDTLHNDGRCEKCHKVAVS